MLKIVLKKKETAMMKTMAQVVLKRIRSILQDLTLRRTQTTTKSFSIGIRELRSCRPRKKTQLTRLSSMTLNGQYSQESRCTTAMG